MADRTNMTLDELRKLAHDVRNHVFVLDMGLDLLELNRERLDEFTRVTKTLRAELQGLAGIADVFNEISESDS